MNFNLSNKQAYGSDLSVQGFGANETLQAPERTILEILRPKLSEMGMLDIGVGAGRTTVHFAEHVREYVGFDYVEGMVKEARKRFPHIRFEVADATDMKEFPDHSFDFLLFSYNGIDCVSPEKRIRVLKEVCRVGKPKGFFCFSTHNLLGLKKLLTFQPHRNPRRFYTNLHRYIFTRIWNTSYKKVLGQDTAMIYEGAHALALTNHYIKPVAQVRQLRDLGFWDIRLFGLNGRELQEGEYFSNTDSWIYYLCRIP
ncbi:methyltransferase domain-containing protein [Candidatus Peregrinibacteria bacterium]|nr:methyltransferase domain-containing protein [Candidatus Peregrinibacteria bacterium]